MPDTISESVSFDYALVRVAPSIVHEEFINAGVILFCRPRRFLGVEVHLDQDRLTAIAPPEFPVASVHDHLELLSRICRGEGPIGALPLFERFHWLVAPKSTVIQVSPVHSGRCQEPAQALEQLRAAYLGRTEQPSRFQTGV